jgi:toxin FitB
LKTWLIDTALFATLAPASSQKSGLRHWLETHREPVFLSAASVVEIEAAIGRVPASQQARLRALRDWLEGLVSAFSDRIHPLDVTVAVRAGMQCDGHLAAAIYAARARHSAKAAERLCL